MDEIEKDIKQHMRRRDELANDIIKLLKDKEPGITFEKAEEILLDTIHVLQNVSKRREI